MFGIFPPLLVSFALSGVCRRLTAAAWAQCKIMPTMNVIDCPRIELHKFCNAKLTVPDVPSRDAGVHHSFEPHVCELNKFFQLDHIRPAHSVRTQRRRLGV